jgi:chromosome segregation ATPase
MDGEVKHVATELEELRAQIRVARNELVDLASKKVVLTNQIDQLERRKSELNHTMHKRERDIAADRNKLNTSIPPAMANGSAFIDLS